MTSPFVATMEGYMKRATKQRKSSSKMLPIQISPYKHQVKAYKFVLGLFGLQPSITHSEGAALLMAMGTGKSLVSVAVMGTLYQKGLVSRAIVVCPLSVIGSWESEFHYAAYPVTVTALKGTSVKKQQQISSISDQGLQVILVNYESARILVQELLNFKPDMVIADEAHRIKDGTTKQARAMHQLGDLASYKLLLTGTVITNHEMDVYSQYRFLNPTIYGKSFYIFRNRYFELTGYGHHVPVFKSWMADDFLQRMHSIAYRVTKDECLDLPEQQDITIPVDLEPEASAVYQHLKQTSFAELEGKETSAVNILTKLLRLSQVTGGFLTDDDGQIAQVSNAKLDALSDILDSAARDNAKVVVMARFKPELDAIEALLAKKDIGYAVVRGGVKDRAEEVCRFQEDPSCMVFIGQLQAASLGITLTAAHIEVFYSLDYSSSNFDQAKSRIHRIGQHNTCLYYYLVAKGTVDEKVLDSLRNKIDLAAKLVDEYRRTGKNPFEAEKEE